MSATCSPTVAGLLRSWRLKRRMSQLTLACQAEISSRHLSFLETGRSLPSREMVLHLSDQLNVPLRDRNVMLTAAGYAPFFPERPLDAPELETARSAVNLVLRGHEPYPALAVDRHWNLVEANRAIPHLIAGADGSLLRPPVNVLRLSLHPGGLAPRIGNLPEWRAHLLERLGKQVELTADQTLAELLKELKSYPGSSRSEHRPRRNGRDFAGFVVPLELNAEGEKLTLIATTTVFGTAVDITLSELTLESFFPADEATADVLRRLSAT